MNSSPYRKKNCSYSNWKNNCSNCQYFSWTMKIQIIKNYWDMEIIGNRRKMCVKSELGLRLSRCFWKSLYSKNRPNFCRLGLISKVCNIKCVKSEHGLTLSRLYAYRIFKIFFLFFLLSAGRQLQNWPKLENAKKLYCPQYKLRFLERKNTG